VGLSKYVRALTRIAATAAAALVLSGASGNLSYTYDSLGRISAVTYPNGSTVTYTYDSAGNRTAKTATAPAPLPPVANNWSTGSSGLNVFGSTTISPAVSDPQGSSLTMSVTSTPSYGTTSVSGLSIIYTPNANTGGTTDQFTYKVTNTYGLSASATITAHMNQFCTTSLKQQCTVGSSSAQTQYTCGCNYVTTNPYTSSQQTFSSPLLIAYNTATCSYPQPNTITSDCTCSGIFNTPTTTSWFLGIEICNS